MSKKAPVLFAYIAVGSILISTANARADRLTKSIDEIATGMAGTRTPGLSIAIDQGGELLIAKGYGLADLENQVPATADTVYRIGSVTKQFTGVSIVQLVDAGKLRLDQKIQEILTDYPAPTNPVTLRHLLQHTSGIPNFTGLPSYRPSIRVDVAPSEMVARFQELPLEFDPGTQWKYSNSGYYLLGMIVEKASGQTYAEYIDEHIFKPAGLLNTRYEAARPIIPHRARGYRRGPGGFENADYLSMTQPFAAGALISTVVDLVRWQRALVEHTLTPPDALERLTSDAVDTGHGDKYGYGIGVSEREGHRVISHGGGIDGFSSVLLYFPETDHTIAVLANTDGFNHNVLIDKISEVTFGLGVKPGTDRATSK